ncbi:hypothetical protein HXX76_009273 [Chlamydomonas incerta]|uniref:Uncharacterized protein n=1 Tax=Chlamydomonas incerta TaxID=51695 RepID=A0A835SUI2_CHLIN|nr:hypothetical protein HXX76_009273 [Chlamydomonas incerta]|eukprot:KAG2431777.1 hypothetical protein HXX76_009273 [Chlamydomonas incerta]
MHLARPLGCRRACDVAILLLALTTFGAAMARATATADEPLTEATGSAAANKAAAKTAASAAVTGAKPSAAAVGSERHATATPGNATTAATTTVTPKSVQGAAAIAARTKEEVERLRMLASRQQRQQQRQRQPLKRRTRAASVQLKKASSATAGSQQRHHLRAGAGLDAVAEAAAAATTLALASSGDARNKARLVPSARVFRGRGANANNNGAAAAAASRRLHAAAAAAATSSQHVMEAAAATASALPSAGTAAATRQDPTHADAAAAADGASDGAFASLAAAAAAAVADEAAEAAAAMGATRDDTTSRADWELQRYGKASHSSDYWLYEDWEEGRDVAEAELSEYLDSGYEAELYEPDGAWLLREEQAALLEGSGVDGADDVPDVDAAIAAAEAEVAAANSPFLGFADLADELASAAAVVEITAASAAGANTSGDKPALELAGGGADSGGAASTALRRRLSGRSHRSQRRSLHVAAAAAAASAGTLGGGSSRIQQQVPSSAAARSTMPHHSNLVVASEWQQGLRHEAVGMGALGGGGEWQQQQQQQQQQRDEAEWLLQAEGVEWLPREDQEQQQQQQEDYRQKGYGWEDGDDDAWLLPLSGEESPEAYEPDGSWLLREEQEEWQWLRDAEAAGLLQPREEQRLQGLQQQQPAAAAAAAAAALHQQQAERAAGADREEDPSFILHQVAALPAAAADSSLADSSLADFYLSEWEGPRYDEASRSSDDWLYEDWAEERAAEAAGVWAAEARDVAEAELSQYLDGGYEAELYARDFGPEQRAELAAFAALQAELAADLEAEAWEVAEGTYGYYAEVRGLSELYESELYDPDEYYNPDALDELHDPYDLDDSYYNLDAHWDERVLPSNGGYGYYDDVDDAAIAGGIEGGDLGGYDDAGAGGIRVSNGNGHDAQLAEPLFLEAAQWQVYEAAAAAAAADAAAKLAARAAAAAAAAAATVAASAAPSAASTAAGWGALQRFNDDWDVVSGRPLFPDPETPWELFKKAEAAAAARAAASSHAATAAAEYGSSSGGLGGFSTPGQRLSTAGDEWGVYESGVEAPPPATRHDGSSSLGDGNSSLGDGGLEGPEDNDYSLTDYMLSVQERADDADALEATAAAAMAAAATADAADAAAAAADMSAREAWYAQLYAHIRPTTARDGAGGGASDALDSVDYVSAYLLAAHQRDEYDWQQHEPELEYEQQPVMLDPNLDLDSYANQDYVSPYDGPTPLGSESALMEQQAEDATWGDARARDTQTATATDAAAADMSAREAWYAQLYAQILQVRPTPHDDDRNGDGPGAGGGAATAQEYAYDYSYHDDDDPAPLQPASAADTVPDTASASADGVGGGGAYADDYEAAGAYLARMVMQATGELAAALEGLYGAGAVTGQLLSATELTRWSDLYFGSSSGIDAGSSSGGDRVLFWMVHDHVLALREALSRQGLLLPQLLQLPQQAGSGGGAADAATATASPSGRMHATVAGWDPEPVQSGDELGLSEEGRQRRQAAAAALRLAELDAALVWALEEVGAAAAATAQYAEAVQEVAAVAAAADAAVAAYGGFADQQQQGSGTGSGTEAAAAGGAGAGALWSALDSMFGAGPLPAELEADLVVLYDTDPAGFVAVRRAVLRQRGAAIAAGGGDAENRASIAAAMAALLSLARTGWVADPRDGGSSSSGAGGGSSSSGRTREDAAERQWSAKHGHAHAMRSRHGHGYSHSDSYSHGGVATPSDALTLPAGADLHEQVLEAAAAADATANSTSVATAATAGAAAAASQPWYARALGNALAPVPLLPPLPPAIALSTLFACALLAAALAVALAAAAFATGLRLTDSSWLLQPRRVAVAAASQAPLPTGCAAARRQHAKQQSRLWAWITGRSCRLSEPLLLPAAAAAAAGGSDPRSGFGRVAGADSLAAADEARDSFDWPPASVAALAPPETAPAARLHSAATTTTINPVAGTFLLHPSLSAAGGGGRGVGYAGSDFLRVRTTAGAAATAADAAADALPLAPCSPADSLISWTSIASPTAAVAAGRLLAPSSHAAHAHHRQNQQYRYCPLSPVAASATAAGAAASTNFSNPLTRHHHHHPRRHQDDSALPTGSRGGSAAHSADANGEGEDECLPPLQRSAVSCTAASGGRYSHGYSHGAGSHFATAYFHARDGLSCGLTTAMSPRTPRYSSSVAGADNAAGGAAGSNSSSGGGLLHRRAAPAFASGGAVAACAAAGDLYPCSWVYAAATPAATTWARFDTGGAAEAVWLLADAPSSPVASGRAGARVLWA